MDLELEAVRGEDLVAADKLAFFAVGFISRRATKSWEGRRERELWSGRGLGLGDCLRWDVLQEVISPECWLMRGRT